MRASHSVGRRKSSCTHRQRRLSRRAAWAPSRHSLPVPARPPLRQAPVLVDLAPPPTCPRWCGETTQWLQELADRRPQEHSEGPAVSTTSATCTRGRGTPGPRQSRKTLWRAPWVRRAGPAQMGVGGPVRGAVGLCPLPRSLLPEHVVFGHSLLQKRPFLPQVRRHVEL